MRWSNTNTDFFLALLKPNDWLKDNAKRIYERYKGDITTSETTFIELLLLAKRFNLDPVRITADYMKEHNLNPLNAF
ncbi:hypothetical protein [Thermococcus sp. M36]|uniref:hypothetical protein n=1 Tax=Thermococcus sp. M36 TaxID=1638261 RepID=UPI001F0E2A4E|nr:hypothetical protein [Thermococcus sp. M36]